MTTLVLINAIRSLLLSMEAVYSFYKKDGAHSLYTTFGNVTRGILGHLLQNKFFIIYSGILFTTFNTSYAQGYSNITLLSFLSCLFILDLAGYLLHKAHHQFSFLWALHSVHHSDRKVNLSTSYRVSWFEQIYSFLIIVPLVLLNFNLTVIALSLYIMGIHSLFCHNCYVNLPRFFDYLFITPENHRVHHDEHIENQNSNYGNLFSVWDRMFGTFTRTKENIVFGIKGYHQDNFIKMETDPILNYFKNK